MSILKFSRFARVAIVGAAVAVAGTASAADLGTRPLLKAPPLVRAYNWNGCYVGATVGWGVGNDWTTSDLNRYNPGGISPWDLSLNSGVLAGGTLGCNWQPINWLVLGVEGEGGYLNVSGPLSQPTGTGAANVTSSAKIGNGYGLIAGRIGVAFDRLLIYGKLGVAFYDASAFVQDANAGGITTPTVTKSETPFAFGGGGEYAIFDHWTGKAEYMQFEKGSDFTVTGVRGVNTFNWNESPTVVRTFKIGLNYKF